MYKNVKPIFFKSITAIHAGTGTNLGLVDLPIQRERHTGFPKIESSGVKGSLREEFEELIQDASQNLPKDFVNVAFGPENDGNVHSGSAAFTDARLLLFPVRSAKGVFAYVTCPYILKRLEEDFAFANIIAAKEKFTEIEGKAQVSGRKLFVSDNSDVVLEEYTIKAEQTGYAREVAQNITNWLTLKDFNYIKDNLIIVPDDIFKDFVKYNTEIVTRIKIDDATGTVATGQLFTEELLPAETVMYSLVMASKIFLPEKASTDEERKLAESGRFVTRSESATVKYAADSKTDEGKFLVGKIGEKLNERKYIQLGGDATIGKGLCLVSMYGGDNQ
ncbi:MAG: type III-B CRISPR module RAMP protein Cmr4 [Clostridiales bacterium]|jgi:CRISPR-associated protein Cmr4|nr:type III-B CRISPR module RAMP protein Cmr4 [Clostridiales bacterium]